MRAETGRTLELRRDVGTKLDRASTRERIMELEIEMIEDHGLTLPPTTFQTHPSKRRTHLDWRGQTVDDLWHGRARLELLNREQSIPRVCGGTATIESGQSIGLKSHFPRIPEFLVSIG